MVLDIIIKLMNVSRRLANGEPSDSESVLNKSQCYVTTAGFKNTFAKIKVVGEVKPPEPRNEGVDIISANSENACTAQRYAKSSSI